MQIVIALNNYVSQIDGYTYEEATIVDTVTNDKSGKVVISNEAEAAKAKPAKTEAPKVETPNAAKPQVPAATPQNISDVETKIANIKGRIENHSKFKGFSNGPQMQKMQAELKNLEAQLAEMQKSVKAAA